MFSFNFQITQSLVSQVSEALNTTDTHTNASASENNHSMYDNLHRHKNNREYAMKKRRAKPPEPDLLGDLNDLNNPSPVLQIVHPNFRLTSKQLDFPELNLHLSRPSLPLIPAKASSAFAHVTTRRGSLDGRSYQKGLTQMAFRTIAVPFPSCPMRNIMWIKLQNTVVGKCSGIFRLANNNNSDNIDKIVIALYLMLGSGLQYVCKQAGIQSFKLLPKPASF